MTTAKRKLSNFNFEHEGAAVALVHKDQGGPANGTSVLILKSTKDVTPALLAKAAQVEVTMDFEDFLQHFFGLCDTDADILARVLGFTDEDEANEDQEDMNEVGMQSYQDYIDQAVSSIKILKSLYEAPNRAEAISELTAKDFVKVLEAQKLLEKAVLSIEKATKKEGSDTLSAKDYAYVPDPEKPSTWKLRIDDATHTSGAVAALGKGFRGNKVEIPSGALAGVKAKVRAAYKKFFPKNDLPEILKSKNEVIALQEEIKKAVEAAEEVLKAKLTAQEVELQKALSDLKAIKEAEAVKIKKNRKDTLDKVIGTEKSETIFKSTESLSDEAFDIIVESYKAFVKDENDSSSMKELGVGGEGTGHEKEDPVTAILKSKYQK